MSQEVRLYKLANGEEIVGRLIEEDDTHVVLTKVRSMAVQPVGPGQMQVAMIPWTVGTPDSNIRISRAHILGEPVEPLPKQLEDGYLQNTSGLQLASGTTGLNVNK